MDDIEYTQLGDYESPICWDCGRGDYKTNYDYVCESCTEEKYAPRCGLCNEKTELSMMTDGTCYECCSELMG